MIKKFFSIFDSFNLKLKKSNIAAYSSSAAFFFFLSFAPMLMIFLSAIPYTPITENMLIEGITALTPDSFDWLVTVFVHQMYRKASTVLPVAIIIALWSGGKGIMGLQMGLNVANEVVENRNFFIIRLQASFYTIIMLAVIMGTFLLSLLTKSFALVVNEKAPQFYKIIVLCRNYRYLFGWLVLTIVFMIIYAVIPNIKLKLLNQLPGALFSAIGWEIFSWGFTIYLHYFNPASTYGSLSTIIVVLIWMYFSMYILLIGANINKYFEPITRVLIKRNRKGI